MLVNSMIGSKGGPTAPSGSPPGWRVYQTMFVADPLAAVDADRPLIVDVAGGEMTFGELHDRSLAWARALMTAGVESMMVPSISKRKPSKDTNSGELFGCDPIADGCAVENRDFGHK
jgi:hypothetical protein